MKKIAIGVDLYNQSVTGGVSKTLNSIKSDADHTPVVLIIEDRGGYTKVPYGTERQTELTAMESHLR